MSTSVAPPPQVHGTVTVDGIQYIERPQVFSLIVPITTPVQTMTNLRLTIPGTAPFLLKGLTRDITAQTVGQPGVTSLDRRFLFKAQSQEGSAWFFSSGLGVFDDRVVDTMCFGNGQFPYPVIPPLPIAANGSLMIEVVDMNLPHTNPDYYPYTIYFGFHGTYLIAAQTPTG